MRLLYVGSYDMPGERFNGFDIHRHLLATGSESDYAVHHKRSNEARVHQLGNRVSIRLNRYACRLQSYLSRQSDLSTLAIDLLRQPYYKTASIIHLQLIHATDFFSLRLLPRLANGRRPVIWTVHDPWLTTGHCIYPRDCLRWTTGCGSCPDLASPMPIRCDATASNWERKRDLLSLAHIHLVVASPWMDRQMDASPITKHLPRTVIPFGVDTSVFAPRDKASCRDRLGIPRYAKVMAIRWAPGNPFKGTQLAEAALKLLPTGIISHVLCIQSEGADTGTIAARYKVMTPGWVDDPCTLADMLAAADVFLMPSTAEAFGLMAIEAMACGTPTVVCEGTALPDIVHAPAAGISVPPRPDSIAAALTAVLANRDLAATLRSNALRVVNQSYSRDRYISRHLSLYESMLSSARQV